MTTNPRPYTVQLSVEELEAVQAMVDQWYQEWKRSRGIARDRVHMLYLLRERLRKLGSPSN